MNLADEQEMTEIDWNWGEEGKTGREGSGVEGRWRGPEGRIKEEERGNHRGRGVGG